MIMKKVFCIIVTYNALQWIDKCLSSLKSSTVKVNTVIVDNCSKDGTIEYIKSRFPEVCIIANEQNRGFGQANNQGMEYAYGQGATHFFLLNQDAWVEKEAIEQLVKVQDENGMEVVSPIHLNGEGDKFDLGFYEMAVQHIHSIDFVSDLYKNHLKEFYPAQYINAAAWMLSKKTIETIGGFDPLFFHYGEDVNYYQRIKYHRGRLSIVPAAKIHHDRIQHGNEEAYRRGLILRSLILLHGDINNSLFSFSRTQIKTHIIYWITIGRLVVTFEWKKMCGALMELLTLYVRIPSIYRSRKQNKLVGPNWIKIY